VIRRRDPRHRVLHPPDLDQAETQAARPSDLHLPRTPWSARDGGAPLPSAQMGDPYREWAAVVSRRPAQSSSLRAFRGSKARSVFAALGGAGEVYMLFVGLERTDGAAGVRSGDWS
jgi:hypothetical protein